ncbi:glycosyltransferase 87 family protein [Stenotrophomonas sp. YIM B06876]|uniref:glycosyltransferase 87 family protein n=1 Tax=Stenotrophomonas sp. YIM B06876 TaxID=3060211 RepID=UPI002739E716|nr:glycosyltransferase 87 family protein [Stenotrophomonas sp. YIM B06876]
MSAASFSAACLRSWESCFAFTRPRNVALATGAVALLAGLLSLWLGQDANWDLRNYHLYNGYAVLEGRLAQDLAPAQMQSYFSPVLDVLHYLMMVRLPAPLAGFAFGVLHGLAFLPVSAIAWLALQGQAYRSGLAPLLGLAGLCTGAFLSELGGSMADNTTALFVLGSLFLVLWAQAQPQTALRRVLWISGAAGALLGIAVALKLTNAIYALALAIAVIGAAGAPWRRLATLAVLAGVALLTAAVLAGWWYWQVWQAFGNPLFPQFNTLFQAPLAAPVSVADTRWLPTSVWEHLAWPLLFTFQPRRISEISLSQCLWVVLYLAALLALWRVLWRPRAAAVVFAPAMRSVVLFFLVAYLLWQAAFSIHRYLVVLELLAPLLVWWLCQTLLPARHAPRWGAMLVGACALVSLLGWNTWGQERWAWQAFAVEAPPMPEPGDSVVLLVGGEPQAWRIPFLPGQARYVAVASNFPESSGFRARVTQMLEAREHRFALVPGYSDKAAARFARMNGWVERVGFLDQPGCERLRWLAHHVRGLKSVVEQTSPGRCRLLPRSGPIADPVLAASQERAAAQARLAGYGWMLEESSCVLRGSRIGQGEYPYQWCRVVRKPQADPLQGNE